MSLRIVFMGTPEFAAPALAKIVDAGHEVAAVYTQPPRPAGRGMGEKKSPVHAWAETRGMPVLTPKSLKGAVEQEAFAAHKADAAVVVAYGLILPAPILDAPREGCLNVHASLLPRWRGAAPIQRAIMAGDLETGVTIMRMEEGLDTGPMCLAKRVAIPPNATAGELHDQLSRLGADLIVTALADLERGALSCAPQPEDGVTYAAKIDKAETRIDFSRPAREVVNLIRGLSPTPGAWFEAGPLGRSGSPGGAVSPDRMERDGQRERVKVLRVRLAEGSTPGQVLGAAGEVLDDKLTIACGEGAVRLMRLQRAGKRAVDAEEFLRGFAVGKGTVVG